MFVETFKGIHIDPFLIPQSSATRVKRGNRHW
jgi:hypothetical protein